MKFIKKLLIALSGTTAILAASSVVLASCSSHNNPYTNLKTGANFTINNNSDANDLMSVAITHLPAATEYTPEEAATFFRTDTKLKAENIIYWSIVYAIANTHANVHFTWDQANFTWTNITTDASVSFTTQNTITGPITSVVENNIWTIKVNSTTAVGKIFSLRNTPVPPQA